MINNGITLEQIDELLKKRISENNKNLVTKQDLVRNNKNLVTKQDLVKNNENLVTKKDLIENNKNLVTKTDLVKNNENLMRNINQTIVENNKEMIEAVEAHLSKYPTKEEFYASQDKIYGELKDLREEVTIHNHQVQRNSDDIEEIKKVVFKN